MARSMRRTPRLLSLTKDFGAVGDGVADCTDALRRAGEELARRGGGRLFIPKGVYLVGRQDGGPRAWPEPYYRAAPLLRVEDCADAVEIFGECSASAPVSIFRAASGLRFGAFDPSTGAAHQATGALFDPSFRADAYHAMIALAGNADVHVHDLELDGAGGSLELGGPWGDVGRQCGATGVVLHGNRKARLFNVVSRRHGADGVQILDPGSNPNARHELDRIVCSENARNNLSWVGGSNLSVMRSTFERAGKLPHPAAPGGFLFSSPAAGVDIEPEGAAMENGWFHKCRLSDNRNAAMISEAAPPGSDVHRVAFDACAFEAGEGYAIYVKNPEFRFSSCLIAGQVVAHPSQQRRAGSVTFHSCAFEDRNAGGRFETLMVDASYGAGSAFVNCSFASDDSAFGNFSNCDVVGCRFEARFPSGVATGQDWAAIFYFRAFQDCTFFDAHPTPVARVLTVNVGANTVLKNIRFEWPQGRLRCLCVAPPQSPLDPSTYDGSCCGGAPNLDSPARRP